MNVGRLVNYQQCWFGSSLQTLVFKQVVSHKNVNCEGENKSLFSAFCFYSSFIFLFFVGLPLFLFFLYPRLTPVSPLVWFLDLVSPISSFFAPFQVTWLFCLKLPSLKPSSASPTLPLSRVLPGSPPILSLRSLLLTLAPQGLPMGGSTEKHTSPEDRVSPWLHLDYQIIIIIQVWVEETNLGLLVTSWNKLLKIQTESECHVCCRTFLICQGFTIDE